MDTHVDPVGLASIKVVVLDVDGTLYDAKSEFGKGLYRQIASGWRLVSERNEKFGLRESFLKHSEFDAGADVPEITAENLGTHYLAMIKAIVETATANGGAAYASEVLDQLYGDNHHLVIEGDPNLVAAVCEGMDRGIRFVIDSNGPVPHTMRTLLALGFPNSMVNNFLDQNCLAVEGAIEIGMQKRDPGHFKALRERLQISAKPDRIVLLDDKMDHLDVAVQEGLRGVWVRRSSIATSPNGVDAKTALQHGVGCTTNVAAYIQELVNAHSL